jgi:hypothetical protein
VARAAIAGVAAGRLALGIAAIVRPTVPLQFWVADDDAARPGARVLARALGGRDVALGVGALVALSRGGPVPLWALAGAGADLVDLAATVVAGPDLPGRRRRQVVALAGGAAVVAAGAVAVDVLWRRRWARTTADAMAPSGVD